ncbi:ribonuclease T2 family protein [Pseudomonas sp. S2_H01]
MKLKTMLGAFGIGLFFSATAFALDVNEETPILESGADHYDYLVYAMTWQPTYCLLNACKTTPRSEFYTHGIWPYLKTNPSSQNRHPDSCTQSIGCTQDTACALTEANIADAKAIPGFIQIVTDNPEGLMKHEWQKHGTCYGGSSLDYFKDFINLRTFATFDEHAFGALIGVEGGTTLSDIQTLFPPNTSYRCATYKNEQYLFEVFYLLNKDRTGAPYIDQGLQIGTACDPARKIVIPTAPS